MPKMSGINPFKKAKEAKAQMLEMARKQEEDHAHHLWEIEQEKERHAAELQRKHTQMQDHLERQRKEARRRLQAQQADQERRRLADIAARQHEQDRLKAAHERELALEQFHRERLETERRDRERREQLTREREKARRDKKLQLVRRTSPEALRSLRELIRRKYELDMAIWADRKVRAPLRPDVEVKMEQADAALLEILQIVKFWGEEEGKAAWQPHEWELASQIKERLERDGKRWWAGAPPWEED